MWLREIKDKLAAHQRREVAQGSLMPAAVLIPLSIEIGALCVTFLERTRGVNHAGQISFPGGHYEGSDENLLQTALRETTEEIGVEGDIILPLGQVSDQITPTGFWIRPFVGAIPAGVAFANDRREVRRVFTVPVADLVIQESLPPVYRWGEIIIWGVTARFLNEFLEIL